MTANELRKYFNDNYGIDKEWPSTHEVDAETYANCCQEIFDYVNENLNVGWVHLGVNNNGLIFKTVELIYRPQK